MGEVKLFAGNFAPRGWAEFSGQLIAISSNTALFSILGTQYGGDGRTTFALPDLRGRTAVGVGRGPGLTDWREGHKRGSETTTLTTINMPSHTHQLSAGGQTPAYNVHPDKTGRQYIKGNRSYITVGNEPNTAGCTSSSGMTSPTGNSQPFRTIQPSLGLRYIICIAGTFPSRS